MCLYPSAFTERCHSERMTALHATYLLDVALISVQGIGLLEYLSGYCLFKDSSSLSHFCPYIVNYLICIPGKRIIEYTPDHSINL